MVASSDARELFRSLIDRGFSLSQDDAVLVVEPPHLLTPTDITVIRAHKPKLLALLSAPADHRGDPPTYRCPTLGCGQALAWGQPDTHRCTPFSLDPSKKARSQ